MTTSNNSYGEQKKGLEAFNNSVHNVVKSSDLMPCPRRPAKKWSSSLKKELNNTFRLIKI